MRNAVARAMNDAVAADGSLPDRKTIAACAVGWIGRPELNRDGRLVYECGDGFSLIKRMQEEGPLLRMERVTDAVFTEARAQVREVLRTIKEDYPDPPETKKEEAQRFWRISKNLQEIYDLPVRWERITPSERNSAFLEVVTKRELSQVVRTQDNQRDYGSAGVELFHIVYDEMEAHEAKDATTIAEVFGRKAS